MMKKPLAKGGMMQFAAPKPVEAEPALPIAETSVRNSRRIFDERKPLVTRLSPEQHKRLRVIALELNMTVQDLVMDALGQYLENRGLPPLSSN